MGNNNTSGMQEQDNSAVEAGEEVLHGAGANADGVEGEKQVIYLAEDKDFHEKVNGLVSDVQSGAEEANVLYQTSNQSESSEVETVSNEVGEGDTKLTCLSKEVENHEKQKEFDSVGNLFGENNHQPEKQTTIEKEEERARITTFAAISATLDAEPRESLDTKPDQRELVDSHDNSCVEDDNEAVSSTGSESSHPLVTDHSNYLEGDGVSNTKLSNSSSVPQKEQVSSEEKCVEGVDDDGNDMKAEKSGIEKKCNGDFFTEMNLEAVLLDKPFNCHQEVSAPEDKCITFTEEGTTIAKFSGNESKNNDQNPNQLYEEATESTISKEQAAQPELNAIGLKYENEEHSNLECQNEEAKIPENGYPNDVMLAAELTYKSNETEAVQEIDDKTEALFSIKDDTKAREMENQCPFLPLSPENGEAFVLDTPVSVYTPHHMHDIVLESETVKSSIESSHVSTVQSQDHQEDTLIQSWCGQGGSEALLAEAPAESLQSQDQHDTSMGSEVVHSSNEQFLPQAPTQEQENVMADETRSNGNDSNIDLKQKSGGNHFTTKALLINSADLIEEILGSEVKFVKDQIGKEMSKDIAIAPKTLLEAKTSENQSSEQNAIVETPAFAENGFKAQEGPRRFSTESKPDDLAVPAHIQKSPSFNFDIRLAAKTEESDQTPLLYHDKRNSVRLLKPTAHSGYSQDSLRYQAMPVEEKVITLDRSDSNKSRTPFLGFEKEEEEAEANIAVTATAKKATKVASTSPKTKEKHKRKTSLFSNCMCCATVIN
ncbi:uncharacterized protein LOC119986213 isoform X1 [Tripterygium wilfordii]|uniref:uncharacterized protein LOC119986213 isoform X1 n=1 Tax=Tripterygium wilfordii TaxID=458696 RepID=UPI0018F8359D|nr:uncharacterized protein LOC119986213 isoform X1 [Tripterygium wilfordii]